MNIKMKIIFIIVTLGCGVFGDTSKEKLVSVIEGESFTLDINLADIHQDDKILWMFGPEGADSLLGQIEDKNITYEPVKSFKDRLDINILTGDLTIKNTRKQHSGRYKAVISSDTETSVSFNVNVAEPSRVLDVDPCEVKSVSVTEGDPVTLSTEVQTHRGDLIVWRFGLDGVLIAKDDKEDNKSSIYDDKIFRGRLKMDHQSGDLTITDTKTTDTGVYKLKISSNGKNTQKTFSVAASAKYNSRSKGAIAGTGVTAGTVGFAVGAVVVVAVLWYLYRNSLRTIVVCEGDDVILPSKQSKAVMEWIFNEEVIARLDKKNKDFFTYAGAEERFKDRLVLDPNNGNLTIRNIKTRHSGLYKLTFKFFFFRILGLCKIQCNVIVKAKIISEQRGCRVTLEFGNEKVKEKEEIVWTFGAKDICIAHLREGNSTLYNYTDDRFDNNLKIDKDTGSLIINNLTPKNTGAYQVQILRSEILGSKILRKIEYKKFYVTILVSAELGGTVTLQFNEGINTDDCVKWIFDDKIDLGTKKDNGAIKYTEDKTFKGRLEMNMETGNLTIRNIRQTDGGIYKLQRISSDNKIFCRKFTVEVRAPGEVNSGTEKNDTSVEMTPLKEAEARF